MASLNKVMLTIGARYVSDAEAAAAYGLTKSQWARLKNEKVHPTKRTLKNLGIKATYEIDDEELPKPVRGRSSQEVAHQAYPQGAGLSITLLGSGDGSSSDRPRST